MSKKFAKNLVLKGKIKLVTGLHIGGLKETVEIGGMDNPVITTYKMMDKRLVNIPYIPGSSLKGKVRSLLEIAYADDIAGKEMKGKVGYVQVGENYIKYGSPKAKLIPQLFGIPANTEGFEENISRILVRDAYPTDTTIQKWNEHPDIVKGTEVKMENTINRITSAANPRPVERIPAESVFEFEIVLTIYEGDNEKELLSLLLEGLKMLEDNYLGGYGSRGYGKLEFYDINITERTREYYENGTSERDYAKGGSVDELIKEIPGNS